MQRVLLIANLSNHGSAMTSARYADKAA